MLFICEDYAKKNNLEFSTDPDPSKSKSKCVFFNNGRQEKPAPVWLCGRPLAWWDNVDHLGHRLDSTGKQEHDCNMARGAFIGQTMEILNMFEFASPEQKLTAIQLYCCAWYGSTLWNLYGTAAGKVYRLWSTTSKLAHNLDRRTHTYFVDHFLTGSLPNVKQMIIRRYVKFVQTLNESNNSVIWSLAKLASNTVKSCTGLNIRNIEDEFKLDPLTEHPQNFSVKKCDLLPDEIENIELLQYLLHIRSNETDDEEIHSEINQLITNLCIK